MSAGDRQTSRQINQMPIKQGVIINKVLVAYQKFLSAHHKYCTNNRHFIDKLMKPRQALSLNYFLHASEYFFRANTKFRGQSHIQPDEGRDEANIFYVMNFFISF